MKKLKQATVKGALVVAAIWLMLAVNGVQASEPVHVAPAGATAEHAVVVDHAASGAAAHADAAHGDGHKVDSLSPAKLKDLGLRVMNFVALMIILVKFGAKPLGSALSGRRKQIREELEAIEAKKADAERAYKEFSAKLASVEKDVDQIVEKAVAQAEIEKARIIERAEKTAEDIKRQAKMAVANEVTAARRMLKNEIADQAAVMAEALIVKNLTMDDQVKIVEDYLDKVGAIQ